MKSLYFILFSLCCFGHGFAQNKAAFKYEAELPMIEETGFYQILLKPEHIGHLNNELSDIRIFDENSQEVPYLMEKDRHEQSVSLFRSYEILEEKRVPGRYSLYTLHNPEKKAINNLNLIIKNAAVNKDMRLYGSEDMKEWFVVKEHSKMASINNQKGTSEIKLLDFPLSDYRYFKLEISDSLAAPIQVTSIGYYEHFSKTGNYVKINPHAFLVQHDHNKKVSVVTMAFPFQQLIDQVELQVDGTSFYHRDARIEVKIPGTVKKPHYRVVRQFSLDSFTPHIVKLEAVKTDTLRIVIENKDNPPLQLTAEGWQLKRYLAAHLEKGKSYNLQFGNKTLRAPVYDLQYFRDSIPRGIPIIEASSIIHDEKKAAVTVAESMFNSPLYIWGAILLASGILGYVTYKMVKEMDRK